MFTEDSPIHKKFHEKSLGKIRPQKIVLEKYQYLQEKLEKWLLSDLSIIDEALEKTQQEAETFIRSSNIEQLEELFHLLPLEENERIHLLFASLRHYFNGGILLKKNHLDQGFPFKCFFNGQLHSYPSTSNGYVPIPKTQPLEVLKAKNSDFLRKLHVEVFAENGENSTFLISPLQNYTFVLTLETPEPWLTFYMEQTRKVLIKNLNA